MPSGVPWTHPRSYLTRSLRTDEDLERIRAEIRGDRIANRETLYFLALDSVRMIESAILGDGVAKLAIILRFSLMVLKSPLPINFL